MESFYGTLPPKRKLFCGTLLKNSFPKKFLDPNFFSDPMNLNENDLWRDETELLNLSLSKLPSSKVLLKLEFDT